MSNHWSDPLQGAESPMEQLRRRARELELDKDATDSRYYSAIHAIREARALILSQVENNDWRKQVMSLLSEVIKEGGNA